ncbi:hypothetical protein AXG93_2682s1020 [Marchantia polymorpha subsp. ruderalis]|uniref:Uncharacterized protein n=1 Tax=Marchantia polymorpha subsp. ruderalis TaxID=1480154 RepID=A0A176WPU6_MARPO|nr:hypothetical protein AXG93_2682s1020 [Marchantia polymorpha subsp. ruderalis]
MECDPVVTSWRLGEQESVTDSAAGLDHRLAYLCFSHEQFDDPVKYREGFMRSGLRYRLPLPIPSVVVEEQGTSNGLVSIASGSMSGDAGRILSFSPILEFFKRLRKNYHEVKTEKLRSLHEFEQKTIESFWEAYTRHPQDRCFDLHRELTSGDRGLGDDAPQG